MNENETSELQRISCSHVKVLTVSAGVARCSYLSSSFSIIACALNFYTGTQVGRRMCFVIAIFIGKN